MHDAAFEWVSRYRTDEPVSVLDIGGRNVNGTVRDLFPNADYTALDALDGDGVDIVADAADWTPERTYDVVVCTEVFEHTADWPAICVTAFSACRGCFIVTTAAPGRTPHSAIDGLGLREGEWYQNIEPDELAKVLDAVGFRQVVVDHLQWDVRAYAVRG